MSSWFRGGALSSFLGTALALLLVGCSSEGSQLAGNSGNPPPPTLSAEVATLYPSYSAAVVDWERISDYQRELLLDGELTFDDYEAAVLAFTRCIEESGLHFVDRPIYNEGNRKFEYSIATGSSQEDAREGDSKVTLCAFEHISSVQAVWNWINRPSQAELGEADDVWRACLRDGGESEADIGVIPVWGSERFDEWIAEKLQQEAIAPSAEFPTWRRCFGEVRRQFPSG